MDNELNLGKIDEHWKKVAMGGSVIVNTPEQLWKQAEGYFKWVDENPISINRTMANGKRAGETVLVYFKRPYTVKGFCLHANISERYIKDISETHEKQSEMYLVMEKILYIIYNEVLEGGLVDIYNPVMVTKLLKMDGEQGDDTKRTTVTIVDSISTKMHNSESSVIANLDFQKVESVNLKSENQEMQNPEGRISEK
jgi:hypothetical protein